MKYDRVLLIFVFCFFLQHFLRNEPVIGVEYEAQLQKTIIPCECLLLWHC